MELKGSKKRVKVEGDKLVWDKSSVPKKKRDAN